MHSLVRFIAGCSRTLRNSRPCRVCIAFGFLLLLPLQGFPVNAETPGPAEESDGSAASPAKGSPISVEELAQRLQRLEQQNAKLAEQNQALEKARSGDESER